MIKHIVLSGGGPNNIIQLGCLKQLYDAGVVNVNKIESIYGTSAGAILGVTIALKYDINVICDYFIKRPWHKVFNFNPKDLVEIIENNGYMDRTFVEEMLDTFLTAKHVSKDLSLLELYELSNIRFNIYTIRLEPFEKLVLNHENYPSMPVKTAILMSCALPPVFKPVLYNGSYYIDGGMICNYPINDCILRYKNIDEIIGLHVCSGTAEKTSYTEDVTMPDYTLLLVGILVKHMQKQNYFPHVNEIVIKSKFNAVNINAWKA